MAETKSLGGPSVAHASASIWSWMRATARTTRPMEPRPIHRGSGTFRVRTSAAAATRRNAAPITRRVTANPSMSPHRGELISSVPQGGLPPARVAQPGDDTLLVATIEHLGQAEDDRSTQGQAP